MKRGVFCVFKRALGIACFAFVTVLWVASASDPSLTDADWEERIYSGVRDLPREEDPRVFLERTYGQKIPEGTEIVANVQAGAFFVRSSSAFLDWLDKIYGDPLSKPFHAFVILRRYRVSPEETANFLKKARASSALEIVPKGKPESFIVSVAKSGHKFPAQIGGGAEKERLEVEIVPGLEVCLADCAIQILSEENPTAEGADRAKARFNLTVPVGEEEFICLNSKGTQFFLYTVEVLWESRTGQKGKVGRDERGVEKKTSGGSQ